MIFLTYNIYININIYNIISILNTKSMSKNMNNKNNDESNVVVDIADNDGNDNGNDSGNSNNNGQDDVKDGDNYIINYTDTLKNINKSTRKMSPFITIYEKMRLIGIRAEQISTGAPVFTDVGELDNPIEIAKKELAEGKTPLIVRRRINGGDYEDWRLTDLIIK